MPQAFLSRAVQQLSASCQQQGLPGSAVAKKLRTRGINLAQLQERAAEVQRGVAECANDEGWNLIQVRTAKFHTVFSQDVCWAILTLR